MLLKRQIDYSKQEQAIEYKDICDMYLFILEQQKIS